MKKALQVLQEVRLLSPRQFAFRVGYELKNRSGLHKRLRPIVAEPVESAQELTYEDWMSGLPGDHWLQHVGRELAAGTAQQVITSRQTAAELSELQERAKAGRNGRIRCYSRWMADYGTPIDWHWSPSKECRWPANVHWSEVFGYAAQCGDIKDVWELNRFPHCYDWVRMYALSSHSEWVTAFTDQLRSWEAQNPYRAGVNWASGQEVAVRLLTWTFAVAVMGVNPAFGAQDFQRFLRLVERHAEHIEDQISFARFASHNNHLIGEALGVYAVGSLFPFFESADRWKGLGRKLLLGECLEQFYDDGGYCQSSHNYQRLALHYLLWAHRLFEGEDDVEGCNAIEGVMAQSGEYLASFMSGRDGRLPNRGANDGALFTPWTTCDYSDFRPLLSALRYATSGRRAFPDGPWDEELFWLWGAEAVEADVEPFDQEDRIFPVSGLHVLREGPDSFAAIRCGTLHDRFAQADQLHVDIFWRGINVAQDPGSYRYNDELDFHDWMMGTKSHNTISVDGLDQMKRIRRFKWIDWPKAEVWPCGEDALRGTHDGYEKLGVSHYRSLRHAPGGWDVVDDLWVDGEERELTIHWLLCDHPYELLELGDGRFELTLDSAEGPILLALTCVVTDGATAIHEAPAVVIERAKPAPEPRGWVSRYYGEKQPALSVMLRVVATGKVRFESSFQFPREVTVGRE